MRFIKLIIAFGAQHEKKTYDILVKQLGEDDSRTKDSQNWMKTFKMRELQVSEWSCNCCVISIYLRESIKEEKKSFKMLFIFVLEVSEVVSVLTDECSEAERSSFKCCFCSKGN